jgi:hypothetical protein
MLVISLFFIRMGLSGRPLQPTELLLSASMAVSTSNSTTAGFLLPKLKQLRHEIEDYEKKLTLLTTAKTNFIAISPAFQWAQNSTSILLQVKLTRRWNAPGSANLVSQEFRSENECSIEFGGFGEHSGHKYHYKLDLELFEEIDESKSSIKDQSAGRYLIVLAKKTPGVYWPRLLRESGKKFDNMHVWLEMSEKYDISNFMKGKIKQRRKSPCACRHEGLLYCVASDECVGDCSQCEGFQMEENSVCLGPPSEAISTATFKDEDGREGFISGKLTMNMTEYLNGDITGVQGSWLDSEKLLIPDLPDSILKPEISSISCSNATCTWNCNQITVPTNSTTAAVKHMKLVAFNDRGVSSKSYTLRISDFITPVPPKVKLSDDGSTIEIEATTTGAPATGIAAYFSSNGGKCTGNKGKSIDVKKGAKTVKIPSDIPSNATHIVVFGKTDDGDLSTDCEQVKLPPKKETKETTSKNEEL